ncbi:molybdenum cofactor guanylyltransferase MobA [Pseudomonas sp. 148P]|uniref:Molybdenum cofactor guanylyltransferase n=1 Tax=Pseudomonas ulcerans TaxID=3115852 RepID=A0ABU7HNH3_9PSED|nr:MULTISPECIES: molybdenum cofactor guanylyltransferase MobA [unclassified Pseudomonas]MEE1926438.1 molybdenum cofactor guanylyltransferase MobA [Pseudomonas sp. 147P]MEE1933087.1 molybdenum cofactor guanylyltransferase MobA [Pseudomonas sp. 148P]
MNQPSLPPCSILILAGGRGQRMGGRDKGLLAWRGEPLIAHLQRTVRPLTDDLIISCNRNAEAYRPYADQLVHDQQTDFPGPMAGVLAGLRAARHDWLLVLACDAPQVDRALLESLLALADDPHTPVMVRQAGHWQPMFSLIPRALTPTLSAAWESGERSLSWVLRGGPLLALECAEDDPRLANFNTPEYLDDDASAQS